MFIDQTEIKKLDDLLKKEGIPHEFVHKSFAMGDHYQICIPSVRAWAESVCFDNQPACISVSINSLTAGHVNGMIELWERMDDPVGNLTAEAAMKLIKERMR